MTEGTNGFVMENDSDFHGVFISEATIQSARSVSNEDVYKNGQPVDCGIEFTLDIGKDFFPKMTISGNFKVDASGKVSAGSATSVKIALGRLGVKWGKFNPDNSIPQDVLDQCVGKKIVRLQYPHKRDDAGKVKFRPYKEFFLSSVPNAKEKLREKFDKDLAAGYVKMLEGEDDMTFPPPTSEQTEAVI